MTRPRTARIERHGNRFRVAWMSDGDRNRRSFETEKAAKDFVRRLHRQALASDPEAARLTGGLSVREVVENWYRGHRSNLASGTQRDYEGRIRRDVGRIGTRDANALAQNPRELRAFYTTLTPTNARRLHAILRQAFADAVLHDEVERNPCEAVNLESPEHPKSRSPPPLKLRNSSSRPRRRILFGISSST